MRIFVCSDCKYQWKIPFGTGQPQVCPECKSKNIHRSPKDRVHGRAGGY